MAIALTDERRALAESVAGFAQRHTPIGATRAAFDDLAAGVRPVAWEALIEQGLTTLVLPPSVGGGGGDLADLAVAVEAAGFAMLPGPYLPTVLATAVLARGGAPDAVLTELAGGAAAACTLDPGGLGASVDGQQWTVSGSTGPLLGALAADVVVLCARVGDGDDVGWFVLDEWDGVDRHRGDGVDLTRDIGWLELADARVTRLPESGGRSVGVALLAAEAVGIARWCLETAVEYAKVREQFGHPIGSFQAIKHRCARLFTQVELMTAAAWDAAESSTDDGEQFDLAVAAAAVTCIGPAVDVALECLTLLGGIGYTWEHDLHLYWRRAISLAAIAGPVEGWRRQLAEATKRARRSVSLGAVGGDEAARAVLAEVALLAPGDQQRRLSDEGLVAPHYPPPYGRGADPSGQVAIAEEYARAGVAVPAIVIGEWALPTIIAHGSDEQREFFVRPTLRGDIVWCQLFSEPGAGSDLASVATRAERVEGGWLLNGQKVWTSLAHEAQWGICLCRTDPAVVKHAGLSYVLVDMSSPGVEVRPLREANGRYMFNEVFLSDVFVPDDRLVGQPGDGWKLARTTLGNERVSMGGGTSDDHPDLDALAAAGVDLTDPAILQELGAIEAGAAANEALGRRILVRQLSGLRPGPEASVRKVASSWHTALARRTVMGWVGPAAAIAGPFAQSYLSTPARLIGGGTAEIQLNVIAERVLGLPR